jgi:hypothetical protein
MANLENNKILLPDGTYMERRYDRALIMDVDYQERYREILMTNTREGVVLAYIISQMNDDNEFVCDFDTLAKALKYSRASVARAVKLFKENYNDLVTVGKSHGVSRFTIDKTKCFKSVV